MYARLVTDPAMEQDLWGRILRDLLEGRTSPAFLCRDDGEPEAVDYFAAYFEPPPVSEHELLSRLSGRVLDVGCGPGRHTLWLQEHGVEVVGIDSSPGTVEIARARGCRDVRLMDATDFRFPDATFDGIAVMGNNLGIAGTCEGTEAMLRALGRATRPGGLLIGNHRDPLATDNPGHLAYHEANRRAGRPPGQVRLRFEYEGEVGEWFWLLLLEPDRLEAMLRATGWEPIEHTCVDGGGLWHVLARRA